jgi:hypothetical protein
MTIGGLIEAGLRIIDKVVPDPQAKQAAQLKLLEMQQAGEFKALEADLQLAMGQIEVNREEAKSPDFFRSGWRPFVGWTCGGGLFYQIMMRPLFGWIASNAWGWTEPPSLEMDTLLTLLFGLLGLGGMRTYERIKGKA